MGKLTRQGLLLLSLISALFYTVYCEQKCGQTPCDGAGYCCSKKTGQPKNCCCTNSGTGFTISCISSSSESTGVPWWGAVLIVAGVIGVIVAIVAFIVIRRRRMTAYGQI